MLNTKENRLDFFTIQLMQIYEPYLQAPTPLPHLLIVQNMQVLLLLPLLFLAHWWQVVVV